MVYNGCDKEYAEQVTAEHKINVRNGNKVKQEWVLKTSHADNHYLDAEVYAMAAADILGVRTLHLESVNDEKVAEKSDNTQYAPEEDWIKGHDTWLQGGQ